jgi:hypothetical protein
MPSPISSRRGALPQTVHFGVEQLAPGDEESQLALGGEVR